ncbi:MAG: acyl-CoA thioesterase, partial [Gammaproteobacteria bacterium]
DVSVALRRCRRASLEFFQAIRRGEETLTTARVRIAAVGAANFRPRGMDDALLDELKTLENQESED